MRKPKSHQLPESTREKIAKKYLQLKGKGSRVSFESVAEAFRVTPMQVRRAVEAYRKGAFSGRRVKTRRARPSAAELKHTKQLDAAAVLETMSDSDERFEDEYRRIVLDIAADTELTTTERVSLMHKAMQVRTSMQRVALETHMGSINAEFVRQIVLYFRPQATDDDIAKIVLEVRQTWKASLS